MPRDPLWMRIWISESRWERRLVRDRPVLAALLASVALGTFVFAFRSQGPIGSAVRSVSYVFLAVFLLVVLALALRQRSNLKHNGWLDKHVATQAEETKRRNEMTTAPNKEH
jgi:protein-S-isoprenylcysteine O-methyltransferase Ste14